MKKIYLGVIGFVSVVILFVWCNDSGVQKGDGEAVEFLNSFITNNGGGGNGGSDNGGGGNTPTCGSWSVTTPASCTASGLETKTCTRGDSSYTETKDIPKLTGEACNTGGGGNIYTITTITFNANNGTVSQTSGTTGADGKLTSLPTPTMDGYNFNGWYTATSGGTEVTTSTVFSGNDTIYAQWTSIFDGEWVSDENVMYMNNGSFEMHIFLIPGNSTSIKALKGTYTISNINITITPTHVNGDWLNAAYFDVNVFPSKWYTKSEIKTALKGVLSITDAEFEEQFGKMFKEQTGTYSLSGNNLSIIDTNGKKTQYTRVTGSLQKAR